jgi:tRNA A37 threonylcarbamoyltransferase TsaD
MHPTKLVFCMDNAAMVWVLTYYRVKHDQFTPHVWVVKI